jgi:hypothetical protein
MKLTLVPQRIIPAVRDHVVPILIDAVQACVERHRIAAGRGVDSFSFGTDVWSLAARQFKDQRADPSFPFAVTGPGCVLHYDDIHLRHCRVASSAKAEITDSFPSNARALAAEARHHQTSFLAALLDGEEVPQNLEGKTIAIAMIANPTEGLLAVYLCTIADVEDGRVAKWSDIVEVWRRDAAVAPPQSPDYTPPPAESVPEAEVHRETLNNSSLQDD